MPSLNAISAITVTLLLAGFYLQWDRAKKTDDLAFAKSEFQCGKPATSPASHPEFEKGFLPTNASTPVVHAPGMVELANGDLLAAWFGGSKEGALDVDVHSALFSNTSKSWGNSRIIAEREQTGAELDRYIKKIGNPVLVMDAQSRIWLFYVTVSVGGWSGSSISYKISPDQGKTWSAAKRLITSPLINISTLVKGRPILLDKGLIGLPVYHEQFGEFAEYLIIDDNGNVLDKRRITHGITAIQPWLIPVDRNRAIALMRTAGNSPRKLLYSSSENRGLDWTPWQAGQLPNPRSAVSAALMSDCRYLLVFNHQEAKRGNLSMAISSDAKEWAPPITLEHDKDNEEEYSYPYLLHTGTGEYHLLYTWRREKIAHIRFNEAWLRSQRETEQ